MHTHTHTHKDSRRKNASRQSFLRVSDSCSIEAMPVKMSQMGEARPWNTIGPRCPRLEKEGRQSSHTHWFGRLTAPNRKEKAHSLLRPSDCSGLMQMEPGCKTSTSLTCIVTAQTLYSCTSSEEAASILIAEIPPQSNGFHAFIGIILKE